MDSYEENRLAGFVDTKFKEAMVAKGDLVKEWKTYMNAYNGEYFENQSKPDYKTNNVSNYIFSTIETIRPIMMDNNPRFEVIAKKEEYKAQTRAIDFMLQCDFDREDIKQKVTKELINTLVYGTSIYYVPQNVDDEVANVIPISAFNIYPDPLATSFDDAEYVIYADYVHVNKLKKLFPNKAKELFGSSVKHSELVNDNDQSGVRIDNQVLVCEMWLHDWTSVDVEEDYDGNKKKKKKNMNDVRIITCAPDLGIVFQDEASPYDDGKLPFVSQKCYDVPNKFWGDGEVKRLLSPQTQLNELLNSVIDNAKTTSNMPWILDKNCGIPRNKLSDRPGLIIRKNPGTEVRREQPPSLPAYVQNVIEGFKYDIEQISGVHDSLKGNSEKGVYTAQGILSLQEAAQARVRIKTRALESTLGEIANMIFHRNRQFWKEDQYVRMMGEDGEPVYKLISTDELNEDYDIRIQAASTQPVSKGAMFDLMVRLAQTPAEDGLPMVDRVAVMQYMPGFDAKGILERMESIKAEGKQDQINDQEHVAEHQETEQILQDMAKQMKDINNALSQLQTQVDKDNDEAKLEALREDAYNEGYNSSEQLQSTTNEIEEQQSEQIPDDVIKMIQGLNDVELLELLQTYPELESLINSQMELNKQQSGTIPV